MLSFFTGRKRSDEPSLCCSRSVLSVCSDKPSFTHRDDTHSCVSLSIVGLNAAIALRDNALWTLQAAVHFLGGKGSATRCYPFYLCGSTAFNADDGRTSWSRKELIRSQGLLL